MDIVLYTLLVALVLLLAYLLYLAFRYTNQILYPNTKSYEAALDKVKKQGYYPEDYINSLPYQTFQLKSPYGYMIHGRVYLQSPDSSGERSKNFAIIIHGITMNLYGALKYLPFFYKKGFNVVVFDLRNHGETGGENTSYGYFEKWDLSTVTDYLYKEFGQDITVGLHGESMGGTIAMLNMAMDQRISFGIIDCAFSDLPELLLLKLKQDSRIKSKKMISFVNLLIKIRAGFSIEDVSPLKELPTIKQPLLFIHGSEDTYIPAMMSKAMYAFKMDRKYIYIAEGGVHGTSMATDPRRYDEEITTFLNEIRSDKEYPLGH
jgi:pimeloyl-ACP methyl ester carboxylesterase